MTNFFTSASIAAVFAGAAFGELLAAFAGLFVVLEFADGWQPITINVAAIMAAKKSDLYIGFSLNLNEMHDVSRSDKAVASVRQPFAHLIGSGFLLGKTAMLYACLETLSRQRGPGPAAHDVEMTATAVRPLTASL